MVSKCLKWSVILLFSAVVLPYATFAIYLKWNELHSEIKKPLHPSIYSRMTTPHRLTLIDYGPTSLAQRISLIDGAKESIELEFFIYELDLASRIITQKLIEKTKEGVRIRILVDFSIAVFKLGPIYAQFLKNRNIEVKYYNVSGLYRIFSVQHRSHRKLLIVDGQYALTGGRNIANDYFSISDHYNFLDSDILIEGQIVESIRHSFELYWNSHWATTPALNDQIQLEEVKKAFDFVNSDKRDLEILDQVNKYIPPLLKTLRPVTCNDISFVTDFPGVLESNRRVFQVISEVMANAQVSVLGESPYFVVRQGGLKVLEKLSDRAIKTRILSNGLYSTDAYYTISALYPTLDKLAKTNLQLYVYDGSPETLPIELPIKISKRWGIHSKRAVVDCHTTLIGTYNIDPRSANLNSELLIICRNSRPLASMVEKSIEKRMVHARPVIRHHRVHYENLVKDADIEQLVKYYLAMPLASLFDFLL